jgi:hypothetical protein
MTTGARVIKNKALEKHENPAKGALIPWVHFG